MTELVVKGRPWMRPALRNESWRYRAPIHVFGFGKEWAWKCREDCWAWYPSKWDYLTWDEALAGGLEHLETWHRPSRCPDPSRCTERHIKWPAPMDPTLRATLFYQGHPWKWFPLLPKQVTLRAA